MKAVDESFRSDFGSKLGGEGSAAAEHNPVQQMPLKANGVLHSQTSALTVQQMQISGARPPQAPASTKAAVPGNSHHTLDRLRLSSTGMCAPAENYGTHARCS